MPGTRTIPFINCIVKYLLFVLYLMTLWFCKRLQNVPFFVVNNMPLLELSLYMQSLLCGVTELFLLVLSCCKTILLYLVCGYIYSQIKFSHFNYLSDLRQAQS